MSWSEKRSRDRIAIYVEDAKGTEVKPMVREMDLENLSEKVCREIEGAHVYIELAGVPKLVDDTDAPTEQKRLMQAIHISQRELDRILTAVGATRIHFQASRAHGLVYLPINDKTEHATMAVLAQLIADRFERVFRDAYPQFDSVRVRSGSDRGLAIGTRNGTAGDRELLFIGSPANKAAKLLPEGSARRLTKNILDFLPASLSEHVSADDFGNYALARPSADDFEALLDEFEIDWSEEESRQRVADDKREFPLSEIELSGARVKINFDDLSIRNSKKVLAASSYADVSGFTAFVEAAETDDEKSEALQAFHVIRREQAQVIKSDFDAVRVQYQGDRVQGLTHLPEDDDQMIARDSVEMAVGLQSSFEITLKEALPQIADLGLAVGVGLGDTIATKLGPRGHRDRICLGEAVSRAEHNEEHVGKQEIGIDRTTYDLLDEDKQSKFSWSNSARCYVAKGLTARKSDIAGLAKALTAGAVFVGAVAGAVAISHKANASTTQVKPGRTWAR